MDCKDLANLIFPDVKDYTYYEEKYKKMLNAVTKEDVLNVAQKYLLNPAVISVLAPEEYLKNI